MIARLLELSKPIIGAGVIVFLLKITGLMGGISSVSRSAFMKTGLLDAHAEATPKDLPDFDYRFTIKDLEGNRFAVDQLKGKVIFLNLWATWCGPCRAEMPTIQELYDRVNKEKIAFVILSIDKDQDKDKIVKYIQKRAYTFPVYQPSGYLAEQLRVPSIPTTFIISKDGKIVEKEVGTTNFNTPKFKKFIEELAAK